MAPCGQAWHFYALTAAAMTARCEKYFVQGRPLYTSKKWTVPRACVPSAMLRLCGQRRVYFALLIAMLGSFMAASMYPNLWALRLLAALAHTLFSMGCAYALEWGHGQYPVLWTSWALVLLPLPFASAVARAATVYLFACAGLAKLCVPTSPAEYLHPGTMRLVMGKGGSFENPTPRFEPAWPWLTRRLLCAPRLLRCAAIGTLILELVLMPLTFLLSAEARLCVALLCLSFHFGIWAVLTQTAGTMFFQLSGLYAFGICGELPVGSAAWACGIIVAALPFASFAAFGHCWVMSERWPMTNCALFPWSERQICFVFDHLVTGPTRLVLTTHHVSEDELLGQPIVSRGQVCAPPAGVALHDAFGNLWNWTKVYPEFVAALNASCASGDPCGLVDPTTIWLARSKPLAETLSGRPLVCASLVELDPSTKRVRRVVASSSAHED